MSATLQTVMHRTQHLGRLTAIRKVLGFHMIAKVYMSFTGCLVNVLPSSPK